MTFLEMTKETVAALDKEWNTENTELLALVRQGLNTAYMTVARDKWRPCARECVKVFQGGIPIEALNECFISLKRVTQGKEKLPAWTGKDFVHVPTMVTDAVIEYYYLPVPMQEDDDEPMIPPSQVDPHVYIYFAASFWCSVKRMQGDAAAWDERYRNIVDNISQKRGHIQLPVGRWT